MRVGGASREHGRRCGWWGSRGDAVKMTPEQMRGLGGGEKRKDWLGAEKLQVSCHIHMEINARDVVGCLVQLRAPS